MSTTRGRLGAWAELARLSNAPTCVSNVLVGGAIAAAGGPLRWPVIAAMTVAVLLLYTAGMTLNDLVDLDVDRRERPERPLPSGRITPAAAAWFVFTCMMLGTVIAAWHGLATLGLTLCLVVAIVLYDVLHKRAAASVLLMGLCRALVYLVAAAAMGAMPDVTAVTLAIALGLYVVMVTVVARVETSSGRWRRFWLAGLLPIIAVAPVAIIPPADPLTAAVAGGLAFLWILRSSTHLLSAIPNVSCAIMGWLAGICLMDGFFLVMLGQEPAAIVAAGCFIVTVLGHRLVKGT